MRILLLVLCFLSFLPAKRIITLTPAVNEIVFALGKGSDVVGTCEYCTFPKEAATLPKVGGFFSVSLEKIVALKPDLVIMGESNIPLKPKLQKLGIASLDIPTTSLQDLKTGIDTIAHTLHVPQQSQQINQSIHEALLATQHILNRQKILIVFGAPEDLRQQIFIAGRHLYLSDIISQSGNLNAFTDDTTRQPVLSYEGLIATASDIVIILAPYAAKEHRSKQSIISPWLKLPIPAAKAGTIYVIDKEYAGIPSDRVRFFIQDFERILRDAKSKLTGS